jgi:signal transduction histidine kinase
MGEGHVQSFVNSIKLQLTVAFIIFSAILSGSMFLLSVLNFSPVLEVAALFGIGTIISVLFGAYLANSLTKPTRYLAQAILHISPTEHLVAAPNVDELTLGRELITNLTRQIYSYATGIQNIPQTSEHNANTLLDQLPIPLLGIDEQGTIVLCNKRANAVIQQPADGQNIGDFLSFTHEDEQIINDWLKDAHKSSLTEIKTWQKVKIADNSGKALGYFDVAASFNKASASGIETLISLYDHSDAYESENADVSFVALAVHELRTPLTIMRGYIEAFSEELNDNASPEQKEYLQKMNVSADTLTSFVSNILNVAKINQNQQLNITLEETDWNKTLPQIIDGLRNRAQAYGKTLELRMQPGLPSVAADRATVGEVLTNLIDNAIKYSPSPDAKLIRVISQVNTNGLVETTVQDQGVGIPSSVMPRLFTKFYRNHRTKGSIGGTGLGLYLCKAIVSAHRGNIWASSKEGEGSTFGFTLIPHEQLAKELANADNKEIVRSSHGWIKNHSMQRR